VGALFQDLTERMGETKDKIEYMKMRAVYLRKAEKMKASEVARSVGTSVEMVYHWTHRYKKFGIDGLINKPTGGRIWAYMTLEQEKDLLDSLTPEAMNGLVVITKIVREKAEKFLNRTVSADYAEDLLNRHGWRKVAPRTRHPKSSPAIQEQFKKKRQRLSKRFQIISPIKQSL
jgi:transposase